MTSEEQLKGWTGPSSDTEQDQQERTERMVREAIDAHPAFKDCGLRVYAKGSYPNKTNVRADSDVDVAVQCTECVYWDAANGADHSGTPYQGLWTPTKLRAEVEAALKAKFPDQVDPSGTTAIQVHASSARVEADVVPSFTYRYYFASGGYRDGTKTFRTNGGNVINYPAQQLTNGQAKDTATSGSFKKTVRILKRVENLMVDAGKHREVPSFFMECLVYNCPNSILNRSTWMDTVKGVIVHIWNELEGDEPTNSDDRWLETNRAKWLYSPAQKWTRQDGRDFAKAVWNYLGLAS